MKSKLIQITFLLLFAIGLSCEKQPECYECLTTITTQYTKINIIGTKAPYYSFKRVETQTDTLCDVLEPELMISNKLLVTRGITYLDSCYIIENSWITECSKILN